MRPAVFTELEYATARERATAEGKLLLVDTTAAWGGWCQRMDRTTWVDPTIVAGLGEHALAIEIDVDAHGDVAGQLRIEAMPTMAPATERNSSADCIEYMRDHLRTGAAQLVRALCAAGRGPEADAVEHRACEIHPSKEMVKALENARAS